MGGLGGISSCNKSATFLGAGRTAGGRPDSEPGPRNAKEFCDCSPITPVEAGRFCITLAWSNDSKIDGSLAPMPGGGPSDEFLLNMEGAADWERSTT